MMRRTKLLPDQPLLAAFQTAFVSSATIEAASYEAERSENEIVQHLQAVSDGRYLQPSSLNDEQDAVTRASLDAHIKKVQAEQLRATSAADLQRSWEQIRADYVGRRVWVTITKPSKKPLLTIWYDQQHGYRDAVARRTSVSGVIEDVLLDRNALLIKPTATARLFNSSFHNFLVYVIDPETFTPMIELQTKQ